MFTYVVETERRFYLANEVEQQVRTDGGRTWVELDARATPGCGTCTARTGSCRPCGS